MKLNYFLLFFLITGTLLKAVPADGEKIRTQLNKATASETYNVLIGLQVRAFPTGKMLQKGLEEDVSEWETFIKFANEFVLNEVKKGKAPKQYATYVTELSAINSFLISSIKILFNRFKGTDLETFGVTSDLRLYLQGISKAIDAYLTKLRNISRDAMEQLSKNTPKPARWVAEARKLRTKEQAFPTYKKFFQDYQLVKVGRMPLAEFLRAHDITNDRSAEKVIGMLEKLIFVEELKGAFFKDTVVINRAKEIINRLKDEYPTIITPLEFMQFGNTKDKPSSIILGEVGTLEGALKGLKKEIEALLKK